MPAPNLTVLLNTLRFVVRHPLNRGTPWRALSAFARWQLGARLVPGPVLVPYVEDTRIFARPSLSGATGTAYVGLHDFEDMAFLLHLLRPGDTFADIGANVGSYSVLAAGAVGAQVKAFEPAPDALRWLALNVAVNALADKVEVCAVALGRQQGEVSFTAALDTVNHVSATAAEDTAVEGIIRVTVDTLDRVYAGRAPTLLKLDVEGFEHEVLEGGARTLRSPDLLAAIVEINGSGVRYGYSDDDVHRLLTDAGLAPFEYLPAARTLRPIQIFHQSGNTLYLRRRDEVERRLQAARRFSVGRFGKV